MGIEPIAIGAAMIGISTIAAALLANIKPRPDAELSIEDWKQTYEREKLIKFLPYQDFIEEDEIYITKDGGVGLIIECNPFPLVGTKTYDSIMSVLDILSPKTAIQFSLVSSADTYEIMDAWKSRKTRQGGLQKDIVNSYYKFIEDSRYEPISKNFSAPTRSTRLIISIKLGGKEEKQTMLGFTMSKEQDMDQFKKYYSEARVLKERILGVLNAGYFGARIAKPDTMIRLIYSVLNQNHKIEDAPIWDGSMLTNFMVANDASIEVFDDFLKIDGMYGKSLSTKTYPEEWNMSKVLEYMGSIFRDDNFSSPFIINLNAAKYPESEKTKTKARASIVMSQQMPYALFPRLKLKHQDLQYAMEKMEKGEDLYFCALNIFVFGKTEDKLAETIAQLQTYYRGLGFRLEEDKYINFPSLVSILPLGFDMEIQDFLGMERGRTLFGENIADLAPVSADWKGNNPEMLFTSPRGQMMGFDLFANDAGGFNSFVIGTTGSGKSVYLQWLALNYYLSNNKIWIIDIGRSYEKFTNALEGQFIELKRDNPLCLNPFSHIEDASDLNEYLDFLIDLFLLLGLPREKTLSEQLEKLMKSYLEQAIKESFAKYKQDSCVDTVIEFLTEDHGDDQRILDFIKTSSPYMRNGQYGPFFNGKSTVNFHSDIVCMENDTLENVPDLRDPALMLLTFHISKEIYLSSKTHPGQKHVVIIDEAHKFLGKSAHIDLFIEQAYRRFRKHGAAMILGTQGFEDFYGGDSISRAGRVIVQNSYWKFIMMQTSTSREAIKKSNFFNFSAMEEAMMDSVAPVAGEFGEVMIISDRVTTKARILLSSFLKTLFFTNAELREKIDILVKQKGYTYLEAVQAIEAEKKK